MAKCLVMYFSKCMADANLKTISIKHKIVNFKKHLSAMVLTSRILYCYQSFADFTYFVSLPRELFLHFWLIFRENGPDKLLMALSLYSWLTPHSRPWLNTLFFSRHFPTNESIGGHAFHPCVD